MYDLVSYSILGGIVPVLYIGVSVDEYSFRVYDLNICVSSIIIQQNLRFVKYCFSFRYCTRRR